MTSLIKLLGLFSLFSCSSFSSIEGQVSNFSSFDHKLKKLESTQNILVRRGVFNNTIFNLSKDDESLWINNSSNSIIKFCGIKICFYKFYDFEFSMNINQNISLSEVLKGNHNNIKSYIEFKNPNSSFLSYSSVYSINKNLTEPIFINGIEISYFVVEEEFKVPKIKWSGKNSYYFNTNTNELIKATYFISPNIRPLKVYFYKS